MNLIKELLESSIKDSKVEVSDLTGTNDHLNIQIISNEFQGKTLLEQHQMVMDVLKKELKDRIHAVKIKTMTKNNEEQK